MAHELHSRECHRLIRAPSRPVWCGTQRSARNRRETIGSQSQARHHFSAVVVDTQSNYFLKQQHYRQQVVVAVVLQRRATVANEAILSPLLLLLQLKMKVTPVVTSDSL